MSENQNPEQKARDTIDVLLKQTGWVVQSAKKIDLNAGLGQTEVLRQFILKKALIRRLQHE
jgi:type I site-specific restriction endonuclease